MSTGRKIILKINSQFQFKENLNFSPHFHFFCSFHELDALALQVHHHGGAEAAEIDVGDLERKRLSGRLAVDLEADSLPLERNSDCHDLVRFEFESACRIHLLGPSRPDTPVTREAPADTPQRPRLVIAERCSSDMNIVI